MYKLFFYLLIPILSLSTLPALAAGCAGSGQALEWRPSSAGNPSFLNGTSYSSDDTGPVGALTLHLTNNFTCQGDYQDSGRVYSRLRMPLNNGLNCKNANTISVKGVSGVEWQLSGMSCTNNQLESSAFVSTVLTDYKDPYWRRDLELNATATLQVTDEYWKYYPQGNKRTITIPLPSNAIAQSNITIGPKQNTTLTLMNVSTCTIALSPENLDFGKLSLNDIHSGRGTTKNFSLSYRCSNGASNANGVKLFIEPEFLVNKQQGTFGAKDKDGNMLIFQLKDTIPPPHPVPLATINNFLQQAYGVSEGTRNFTIQVMFPVQQPYPFGAVSTYLNFKLIYR